MRAEAQKALLQQPGMGPGPMNQFGMRGGVPNGMMQHELQKRALQNNTRNLYVLQSSHKPVPHWGCRISDHIH
jgi:hypothetical protein